MHFKNAVILCMLYFVTVTQSAGLNEQQAADIVDFFNDFETTTNEIPKEDIVSFGIDIGMKDMNDFTYNEALTDAQKAQDLLILLANNDKTSDRWTKKNVSSFEVTIIVTVFRKFDEKVVNDGLIDYNELKNLVDSLSLTQEFKDDLKGAFDTDDTAINAAELVKAYLSVKPRDGGINMAQLEELAQLKEKKTGNQINDLEITDFFVKLSIVGEDLKELLNFTPIRQAALELEELVVITAEYSKGDGVSAIPAYIVRQIVSKFDELDTDKDGLLNKNELRHFGDRYLETELESHDANNDEKLDIVEFIYGLQEVDNSLPSVDEFIREDTLQEE